MADELFDDIRPYTDDEIPSAIDRLVHWSQFDQIMHFIYPEEPIDKIHERFKRITTVHELQTEFMYIALKRIVSNTSTSFTVSGLDHIKRGKPYLYVSNHRDITLDAFLLQATLIEHKFDTSFIVFGSNLIASPEIGDIYLSNKLIRMPRGGTPRAFYESLRHLSTYIHHLVDHQHSVWIAQKNGRSKDGIDATAPAMIKMLTLGSPKPPLQSLADLHIVPTTISYEWDPCDMMKTNELYQTRRGTYVKAEGEDLTSVVTGIIGNKGKMHLSIGRPLTALELRPAEGKDWAEHVASLLDQRIQGAYRLMPTNYIAYDMLHNCRRFRSRYTNIMQHRFAQRAAQLPTDEHREIFLSMYANPVVALHH